MVVLGVDPHKKTHTVVATDETGKKLAATTLAATDAGHVQLLRWAAQFPQRRWAVEDGRHVSTRLLRALIASGEHVTCVPTKLMAQARASARTRGKSDPIDALAVARAALREPDLPTAHLDDQALDLRLLVDHRENLVAERTRNINRLRWDLHYLDPTLEDRVGSLTTLRNLRRLAGWLREEVPASVRRDLTIALVDRIRLDTETINALHRQITDLVEPLAPTLLAIVGISHLGAAKILGEVAGIERFPTSAKLAAHAGIACIPVWSGNTERHRLSRGGNRQLNCAIHRVAITQRRHHPAAADLFDRRRTQHRDTKAGAYRVLKRHLVDVIYRALQTDARLHHQDTHQVPRPLAA